jgi:hypothetical protein
MPQGEPNAVLKEEFILKRLGKAQVSSYVTACQ